jgi:formylglycine-generating enzyme required for sulfatase activity
MKLVYIQPGEFQMGSNDVDREKPIHTVKITKGFYMGVYEVTQEQYQKVIRKQGIQFLIFFGIMILFISIGWIIATASVAFI